MLLNYFGARFELLRDPVGAFGATFELFEATTRTKTPLRRSARLVRQRQRASLSRKAGHPPHCATRERNSHGGLGCKAEFATAITWTPRLQSATHMDTLPVAQSIRKGKRNPQAASASRDRYP